MTSRCANCEELCSETQLMCSPCSKAYTQGWKDAMLEVKIIRKREVSGSSLANEVKNESIEEEKS